MLAKIAALVAREIHTRCIAPVITEYKRLDQPLACNQPHVTDRAYDTASTTSLTTERAPGWDHDKQPPPVAVFGFDARHPTK